MNSSLLSGSIRRKPQNDNLHRISNRCQGCCSVRYVVLEMKFVWTQEVIDRASRLWKDGKSAMEIAEEIGVTRNSVLSIMHRYRELFPKLGITSRQAIERGLIDKAVALWNEGASVKIIALETGLTPGQVSGLTKRKRELFKKRDLKKRDLTLHRVNRSMKAKKSPRNDPVNRMSKFNPNAGSKAAWYQDPELDDFELSRLPGVSLIDNDGCMYPLTAEGPHLFCGHLRFKGRYCEHHTYKCEGYKGISISYKKAYDRNIMEVV